MNKHILAQEFKSWSVSGLFMALTVMAVVLWSPVGDNLQDIWNSPGRLTAIEADIDEINERLSAIKLDENRAIKFTSSE